jgi:hypothetical protein
MLMEVTASSPYQGGRLGGGGGQRTLMGEMRNSNRILIGNPEGKLRRSGIVGLILKFI